MADRSADASPKRLPREPSEPERGGTEAERDREDDEHHHAVLAEDGEAGAQHHRRQGDAALAAEVARELTRCDDRAQRGREVGRHVAGLRDQRRIERRQHGNDHPRGRPEETAREEVAVDDEGQEKHDHHLSGVDQQLAGRVVVRAQPPKRDFSDTGFGPVRRGREVGDPVVEGHWKRGDGVADRRMGEAGPGITGLPVEDAPRQVCPFVFRGRLVLETRMLEAEGAEQGERQDGPVPAWRPLPRRPDPPARARFAHLLR